MEKEYKKYVKKSLWKEFKKHCELNSLDFYSCGCILTAHLVMEKLTRANKLTPKEAWKQAMEETPYHSGFSAGCTQWIISHFSPRGEEFKTWWLKEHGA